MGPPRVLILHGWQGSPPRHWQRWLQAELVAAGVEPLELVVDLLPGRGHFNVEAGYGPWPAMRDWVTGGATGPVGA